MKFYNTHISAEVAARMFAEQAFGEKRRVGTIVVGNGLPVVMSFQLVGGSKWYAVSMLPHYAGWEVVDESLQTA
jgi:hypothetical protein